MRYVTVAGTGVNADDSQVFVDDVEVAGARVRISGEAVPPWLGPVDSARVGVEDQELTVQVVEYSFGGYFAVEADGDICDGVTIQLRLGSAWIVLEARAD